MTPADIKLWGKNIGAVYWDDDRQQAFFEFDHDFAKSGIQVSPITMPLSDKIYSFPALEKQTFQGLPGMLADALPDKFGNALIDTWLSRQGRDASSFNPVERLCYIGSRGMGALEFHPAIGPQNSSQPLEIEHLVDLASDILSQRNSLSTSLQNEQSIKEILQVGTSAGGARAKAVIAWNPDSNDVRSGQTKNKEGFEYWLMKFDGVSGNRDKELDDPQGYGLIEYSYYQMAIKAGIQMSECRIFTENNRHHFMTKRFDRTRAGEKLHMQTLCGLAHYDFNQAGAYSYEQVLQIIRKLGLPMQSIEEQYRRMAFNIVARNQDDHVKNIAFLMDKAGRWALSPAYDLTYSYNPAGQWTSQHQMTLNGKRDHFVLEDFKACARNASMKRGRALEILEQVQKAVSQWDKLAAKTGVKKNTRKQIAKQHRMEFL